MRMDLLQSVWRSSILHFPRIDCGLVGWPIAGRRRGRPSLGDSTPTPRFPDVLKWQTLRLRRLMSRRDTNSALSLGAHEKASWHISHKQGRSSGAARCKASAYLECWGQVDGSARFNQRWNISPISTTTALEIGEEAVKTLRFERRGVDLVAESARIGYSQGERVWFQKDGKGFPVRRRHHFSTKSRRSSIHQFQSWDGQSYRRQPWHDHQYLQFD